LIRQTAASTVLSNIWWAKKARRTLEYLRENYHHMIRERVELEIWAATKIQSVFRGGRGREKFKVVVR
jgi:iron-sulfur cluster repair protein YtfE (RIC family)